MPSIAQAASPQRTVWQQGFESSANGAHTYHRGSGPQAKLQIIQGSAFEGSHYLRAVLPGKRALEGVVIRAKHLAGGRITTVSAQVRGKGTIMLVLGAGDGWSYSKHLTLTDQWQTLKVSRTMRLDDRSVNICFLSPSVQTGAVFEIDDIQVSQNPQLKVYDRAVAPLRLLAVNFAKPKLISTQKDGGKVVSSGAGFVLSKIPFPRTSHKLSIYLHTRGAGAKFQLRTSAANSHRAQSIRSINSSEKLQNNKWHWVQFKPVHVSEIGNVFQVVTFPAKGKRAAIDKIVLATDANLSNQALNSARPLLPSAPFATVARITKPPRIDGIGDDACWRHTVAIKDFQLFGSSIPASEPTAVKLAYDANHLYVLAHCIEPLFTTIDQRQSQVIANATQRDHKVLADDSFLMFLRPSPDKQTVYDFTVNTIGTLEDGKMQRAHMWKTRSTQWNSSANVAVKTEDGYWTVEMAIPFSDLGIANIKPGTRWRIGLDRLARSRKEFSSWQPTASAGAHSPLELGIVVFARGKTGIVPEHGLNYLAPGKNEFSLQLQNGAVKNGARVVTMQTDDDAHLRQYTIATRPSHLEHIFAIDQKGNITARWGVFSAASFKPIYLSPSISLNVQSADVALQVVTPGSYRVKVNNRLVANSKKSEKRLVIVPLKNGANTITVQAQLEPEKITINEPWAKRFSDHWALSAENKSDKKSAQHYTRTILKGYTRVWPTPDPAVYIAGNSTQAVTFTAQGIEGTALKDWTTWLAVPKGLKAVGASGYYGNTSSPQPEFNLTKAGHIVIDHQQLKLYKVEASKPIHAGRAGIMSLFQVMFQIATPKYARKGISWKVHYWSQANGGDVIEIPQSFEMRAVAPLHGKQPKKFTFFLGNSFFARMDNHAMQRAMLQTLADSGFNLLKAESPWTTQAAKALGIRILAKVRVVPWSLNFKPFLAKHPDARLTNHNDKKSNQHMCTTLLLNKDWSVMVQQLKGQIKKFDYPGVIEYDYEYSPYTGPHACFDSRCLSTFRKHAGIAAHTKLTPEIIKNQYADQWEDFMAWRAAKICAKMKKAVHKISPESSFDVYSGYQSPRTRRLYGIDWRYIGQMNSADGVGAGYGRSAALVKNTLDAVDGIPLTLGFLMHPRQITKIRPANVATRAVILRRALDATGGVLVFGPKAMDGRSWKNIAGLSRLVSKYEGLFYGHGLNDLKTIPGQNPDKVAVISEDGRSLVCVMNTSSKPQRFQFQLPSALGSGREFYSDESVATGSAIDVTLSPGAVTVYVLNR